jgi:hypothetical protein
MGIHITGVSNVNLRMMKKDEDSDDMYNDENYVGNDNNIIYTKSEKSICGKAYRGYSNFSNWIKNTILIAKDLGIKEIHVPLFQYEYFSTYSNASSNLLKYL